MSDETAADAPRPPDDEGARLMSEGPTSGDPVEDAWAAVEAHWESPEAHKKFLVLCDSLDRLGDAGRRYRAIKDTDPKRKAEAQKQIDALLGFAMRRVQVDKVEPTKARSRVEWIALGLSIVLMFAAIASMLRMLGQ